MSAILTGAVKVTIETKGAGDGAAHVEKATAATKKFKDEVGATGKTASSTSKDVGGFVQSLSGIKESINPLNQTKEVFERLRGNFIGFPVAIAGIVTGIGTLIANFAEAGTATEALRVNAQKYADALDGLRDRVAALRVANGEVTQEEQDAQKAREKAQDDNRAVTEKLLYLDSQRSDKLNELTRLLGGYAEVLDRDLTKSKEIFAIDEQIKEAGELQAKFRTEAADARERELKAAQDLADLDNAKAWGARLDKSTGITATELFASFAWDPNNAKAPPKNPSGGGGGSDLLAEWKARMAGYGPSNDNTFSDRDYRMLLRRLNGRPEDESSAEGAGSGYTGSGRARGGLGGGIGGYLGGADKRQAGRQKLADNIRDFSSALTEALPGMDQFAGALSKIVGIWDKWAETGKNTKTAIVGSLAAIGLAGAERIKNERLRAGVEAIIFGAEGAAHFLTPGMEAQGIAELGAAAVLGGVAIFGGSSGGGKHAGAGRTNNVRPITESRGSGATIININAPWFGPAPQESAAGVVAFTRRADGTGFGSRR